MTTKRCFFTDDFKGEAVALLESSSRPLEHLAKELGIQPSMLRNRRQRVGGTGGGRVRCSDGALPSPASSDHAPLDATSGMRRVTFGKEPGAGNPHARICEGESRMAELLDHGHYDHQRIHLSLGYITPERPELRAA